MPTASPRRVILPKPAVSSAVSSCGPPAGRPAIPGVVIYAGVDGSFSAWDPARNYWQEESAERARAFNFTPEQVWNGLKGPVVSVIAMVSSTTGAVAEGSGSGLCRPPARCWRRCLHRTTSNSCRAAGSPRAGRQGLPSCACPMARDGLCARLGWHATHRSTGLSAGRTWRE